MIIFIKEVLLTNRDVFFFPLTYFSIYSPNLLFTTDGKWLSIGRIVEFISVAVIWSICLTFFIVKLIYSFKHIDSLIDNRMREGKARRENGICLERMEEISAL